MNNPAVTVPGAHRMDVSAEWIEKHPDDWGMVIHELTHTLQGFNLRGSSRFLVGGFEHFS
jgi:hypothetical protein